MSLRALLLVGLSCLLILCSPGCRRRNAQLDTYVDAMAAEYRVLEDHYYDLQFDYERKCAELQALKKRKAGDDDDADSGGGGDSPPRAPDRNVPSSDSPDDDIPDLTPPVVDPGTPSGPRLDSSRGSGDQPAELPSGERLRRAKAGTRNLAGDADPRATGNGSNRVAQIVLNPTLTGVRDFDDQPGDDGLAVVIEPRSEDGRFVAVPGKVVVVALDPNKDGDAARIARWTVGREQVAKSLKTSAAHRGIHLKLGWPEDRPRTRHLHLFVRYETADGRRLEVNREIAIGVPAELSRRWTPRTGPAETPRVARSAHAARDASRRPPPGPSSVNTNASRRAKSSTRPDAANRKTPPASPAVVPSWQPYR